MTLVRKLFLSVALVALGALGVASFASATVTAPTPTGFFDGNINSCSTGAKSVEAVLDLDGPWVGANSGDDTWPVTQVTGDGLTVDISNVSTVNGQLFFNWTANLPVDLAVVKQGPGGAYWLFDPAQTSGTLAAYKNGVPSGGISHVLFCYHPKLTVTKTAVTSKATTYDWTVDKSADPTSHEMTVGDEAQTSTYKLDVTKSAGTDSGWRVSGVITVKNNSVTNLVAVTVTDTLPGSSDLVVEPSCTGAFALAAGATKTCSYSAKLENADTRTNTATAYSGSDKVGNGSGTAPVDFANATVTKINDTATLTDTYDGKSWPISSSSDDKEYTREFSCGASHIYPNTARILGDNPATPGVETTYLLSQDSASVTVTCDEAPVPLLVEKTAAGSFTRTHTWNVTKSVDKPSITLDAGASGNVQWTVGLGESVVDSDFQVSGTIKVSNANAFAVENVDVTDSMSGAVIDCDPADGNQSTGLTIPAAVGDVNGFVVCSYSVEVEGAEAGDEGENIATATVDDDSEIESEPAAWSFDEPTEVDAVVDVKDTNGKVFADVSNPAAVPFPTSYTQTFTCGADVGKHINTVTVFRDGTDSPLDSASAETTVTCNGTPPIVTSPIVTPPTVVPPVVTPPVVSPGAPLLPPTAKPKPKPKPAVCIVITINKKSVAAGTKSQVTVKLTAGGKAVAGGKVRFRGAGINKVVKANRSGVAIVSLSPKQAGIITVTVVGKQACSTQRLGVVGAFEPPVTG